MKALILAGGFGTRMRPLTLTRPKPMLPIANRPHIEHVFDLLERHGVNDVVLTTSYLADAFADAIRAAGERGMTVEVAHEDVALGTAGAIKNAEHLLDGDTFLALNGDVLTDADITGLVALHERKGAIATILLTPVEDPSAFGVVPTDADGRVEGFIEKPPPGEAPTNLINAGVYVLQPSILDRIPAGREWSIERSVFPELVVDKRVFATATDAYWMDVGTPQKYLQANLDALAGRFGCRVDGDLQDGSLIGRDASIEGAQISSACLGLGVRVEPGAVVTRSVLLPGTSVGAGAVVSDSVLGEGVSVAAGAKVEGAFAGDGEHLG